MIEFKLKTGDKMPPYIELNKLLKVTVVCESGAMANNCILGGMVKLNGKVDLRKRAKIKKGDKIEFEDFVINVV